MALPKAAKSELMNEMALQVAVDHRQIDGVLVDRLVPRLGGAGLVEADPVPQPRDEGLGQDPLDVHRRQEGSRDDHVAEPVGRLGGLREDVNAVGLAERRGGRGRTPP